MLVRSTLLSLILIAAAAPGVAQLDLRNGGFESRDASGQILHWTAGTELRVDTAESRSGRSSLRFHHEQPRSSTALSAPVRLEVGKIYRLTGWMKTSMAVVDQNARYPTAVPATLSMASIPFTNYAPPVGGSRGWTKSELLFVATRRDDRVKLVFGQNGAASGTAYFDDVALEEVKEIGDYIPLETVRWFGPAFRYTDQGWTFVHIEGEPYDRGYQYGVLLAKEIAAYLEKLAIQSNAENPRLGWDGLRTLTDALMLRKYDEEYLTEMKGIADGAAKAGAAFSGKPLDLLDVVTINSAVDLGQLGGALAKTRTALTGRSFRQDEEELNALERLHKCSSFLANGPASSDGRIVFGQLFMWGGYTGVHWDVICDVVPSKGHRLVYETFPGGIHSGADFYINSAGIMLGETTVMQTPFNMDGTPQSLRIRKAAQYASSIDQVTEILTTKNNGLYTNDWLIGDVKTSEIAILLLGTNAHKLWRSSKKEFPGGTEGFYWSVNNAKDPGVRNEYVADPSNAPFDVVFSAVNRDVAFVDYYRREKGAIDAISAVNVLATSPLNRPHACDGKVTTSEMAEKLVFLAHYGKVTLREKFPERGSRRMPDLPGAVPHLTLGYTAFSPIEVAERLKALRPKDPPEIPVKKGAPEWGSAKEVYVWKKSQSWINTVYPASDADNWYTSGSAAYWHMVNGLPADGAAAAAALRDNLSELNARLLYTIDREGSMAPLKATRRYDGYKTYVIPRVRGTYLLHQLRLILGNERFARVMEDVQTRFKEKPMTTEQFVARAEAVAGEKLRPVIMQWLEREDLPAPSFDASVAKEGDAWQVTLQVSQPEKPYRFRTTAMLETEKGVRWELLDVKSGAEKFIIRSDAKVLAVHFNAGSDIPVALRSFYTLANLFDDFKHARVLYGTSRQIEANHTLALRYQSVIADQFTEDLLPVEQENRYSATDLEPHDVVLLGGTADNQMVRSLKLPAELRLGKNWFSWKGKVHGDPDEGLFFALPNPANPGRAAYVFLSNSALQLHVMTRRHQSLPGWALFKGEQVQEKGYFAAEAFTRRFE